MTTSELIRLLKNIGCQIKRHGSNHDIWYSPKTGQTERIWRHPNKEVPTGTANAILKKMGAK